MSAAGLTGLVAFASNRDGNFEIYTSDLVTGTLTRVTNDPVSDVSPDLSPDQTEVVFTRTGAGGQTELVVRDLTSGTEAVVAPDPLSDGSPRWSPDGSRIAFRSNRDGDWDIFEVDIATGAVTQHTNEPGNDFDPHYSPDGTKIAYMSVRDGNNEIYLQELASGTVTRLTNDPGNDNQPNFAPDGQRIVFRSDRDGDFDLYEIDLTTSALTQLTNESGTEQDPYYYSDGQHVALASNQGGDHEIYIYDIVSQTLTALTDNTQFDILPSFGPTPALPPPMILPPALYELDAGHDFSCALAADGAVNCWGEGGLGQTTPALVTGFLEVTTGADYGCALQGDGSLDCWGNGASGQTTPPPAVDFTQVSAGQGGHTCGLAVAGSVHCWGNNSFGQLNVPTGNNFIQVTAGSDFSCALSSEGTVSCWGGDGHGQSSPPSFGSATQISGGGAHGCAVRLDGALECWGGISPVTPPSGNDFVQVDAGLLHTCALRDDSTLACFGNNGQGRATPPTGPGFVQVVAGGTHSCALGSDDSISCWGDNSKGQSTPPPSSSNLTVEFPGIANVRVDVRESDGQPGTFGSLVSTLNSQTDLATFAVSPAVYDIRIKRGAQVLVVDDVDCSGATCTVASVVTSLSVDLTGLSGIKVLIRGDDGVSGTVGGQVITVNDQGGQITVPVLHGSYDVELKDGPASMIVDATDCSASGLCEIVNMTRLLDVDLLGLDSNHPAKLELRADDGQTGSVGAKVRTLLDQDGFVTLAVLPGVYDLRLRVGAQALIVDAIDCSSNCGTSPLVAQLDVDFSLLNGIDVRVRGSDGVAGTVGGKVATLLDQTGVSSIGLLRGTYDVELRRGAQRLVVDDVDCAATACVIQNLSAHLTIELMVGPTHPQAPAELFGVGVEARVSDGVIGTVGGAVESYPDQGGLVEFDVLRGSYDVRLKRGAYRLVVDDVDCSGATCTVTGIVDVFGVFIIPGLTASRIDIRESDGVVGTFGGIVETIRPPGNQFTFYVPVLTGTYDLRVKQGVKVEVLDDFVCDLSGTCEVLPDEISIAMFVDNGTRTGVKIEVRESDGFPGSVGGKVVTLNNQSGFVPIEVLLGTYDVRLRDDGVTVVLDDVVCAALAGCPVDVEAAFSGS